MDYLKERGPGFVNGRLVRRTESMLYSPHYPHNDENDPKWLHYWIDQETRSFMLNPGGKS